MVFKSFILIMPHFICSCNLQHVCAISLQSPVTSIVEKRNLRTKNTFCSANWCQEPFVYSFENPLCISVGDAAHTGHSRGFLPWTFIGSDRMTEVRWMASYITKKAHQCVALNVLVQGIKCIQHWTHIEGCTSRKHQQKTYCLRLTNQLILFLLVRHYLAVYFINKCATQGGDRHSFVANLSKLHLYYSRFNYQSKTHSYIILLLSSLRTTCVKVLLSLSAHTYMLVNENANFLSMDDHWLYDLMTQF